MSRKAFVTGATGFVGINLVDELRRQGWQITALHRERSDLSWLRRFPVEMVTGDITDPASLHAAVPSGLDAIFHVAGNTNVWSRRNAGQTRENVDGTRNVVEIALARRARKLVVTSSIAAYGLQQGEINEVTPSNAGTSWINYQRTKWLAEEEVRKGVRAGLRATIMNPGAIIGPYDFGGWSRLFTLMAKDAIPAVMPGHVSCAHVREVVKAHVTAVDHGRDGENYLLAGTEASLVEMLTIIADLLGKPAPKRVLPVVALKLLARLQVAVAAITGKPPQMTPEAVAMLTKRVTCPSRKAQQELGFRLVPLRTMLQDCYDWLIAEGPLAHVPAK
jgi:nucleoside-diphosphate-sugar epimerase